MLEPNFSASLLAKDPDRREQFVASLSNEEALCLLYEWNFWARPEQLTPSGDDWFIWLLLAGRGFGKTRTGAEFIREEVETGRSGRIALIGPTAADARDVMVEGQSGIIAISPPWNKPVYEPSKRRLTWPNGAVGTLFSAEEPDRLRGPQHDCLWADELAAWAEPSDTWDQAMFGLRLGRHPRAVVTTTPRPIPIIRELLSSTTTRITRGRTLDNAQNLAPAFLSKIVAKYEGTRLGRQELDAEVIEEVEGALWMRAMIENNRLKPEDNVPDMVRIAVAIDPATSSGNASALTGIVAAGLGVNGLGYVLSDWSGRFSPAQWANRAVQLFDELAADVIVAEANQGGEMVKQTLLSVAPNLPVKLVYASRSKQARAEPIAALSEQNKLKFVGTFPELEDQLCTWAPLSGEASPDRLDAMVWALSQLMLKPAPSPGVVGTYRGSNGR